MTKLACFLFFPIFRTKAENTILLFLTVVGEHESATVLWKAGEAGKRCYIYHIMINNREFTIWLMCVCSRDGDVRGRRIQSWSGAADLLYDRNERTYRRDSHRLEPDGARLLSRETGAQMYHRDKNHAVDVVRKLSVF